MTSFVSASWERHGGHIVPGPLSRSSRLLIVGDTHGNLDTIGTASKLAARLHCDGVIQLGDFGFWPDQRSLRETGEVRLNDRWLTAVARTAALHGRWWLVIDGNHDFHPAARAAYPADANGIRPIRDGALSWADRGALWTWHDVRFAALGGAVSIDRQLRRDGYTYWSTEAITDADVETLLKHADGGPVDVLLTHDAPALPPSIRPLADPVLRADCDASIDKVRNVVDTLHPSLLLHGHYHVRYSGLHGTTRIEGFASDQESHRYGHTWGVLELETLSVGLPGSIE